MLPIQAAPPTEIMPSVDNEATVQNAPTRWMLVWLKLQIMLQFFFHANDPTVEILPQSQTSVMNDCSTSREVKCRARSLKCENEFLYISLINFVLYILDTEG